jgi:S1-C subfamily serine protease
MPSGDRAVIGVTLGDAGTDGIRVADVTEGGPAAGAGIRTGDHITAVGDVSLRLAASDVEDPVLRTAAERRLRRALGDVEAGDEVTLRVATDGAERTVRLRTVRADSLAPATATVRGLLPTRLREDRASLGLSLTATGSARDTLGAFVAWVAPDSPAERAGVYEGMRVAAINDVTLRVHPADAEDPTIAAARVAGLERELDRLTAGDEVTLRVWADGRYRDVRVRTAPASEVYDDATPFRGLLHTMPGAGVFRYGPEGGVWQLEPGVWQLEPGVRGFTIPAPAVRGRVLPRTIVTPRTEVRMVTPSRRITML